MQDNIQEKTKKEKVDPILENFINDERELSDKLREILRMIKESEDSQYMSTNYLFLLGSLSKRYRIDWVSLENHVMRNIRRLEFPHQESLLEYIFFHKDTFSNKQLTLLYKSLTKIMRDLELRSQNDKSLISHYNAIKKYRHQLFQEMLSKARFIEHTIEDIKFKYFENTKEAIQQLVNKYQFLHDFKLITNNLDQFSKEQQEEYFNFIKNGILKHIIFQFSTPEINFLYTTLEKIPREIKIINRSKLLEYIATRGDPFYILRIHENRVKELEKCIICRKNPISDKYQVLCELCYQNKIEGFPEKFYSKEESFTKFSRIFDIHYQNYDSNKGYMVINIELSFESPFTVMDLEATGDITKDRSHFITTMGFLWRNLAQIYQLVDFSKYKSFKKVCKQTAKDFNRPSIAYNFEGSERIWLNLYMGGWIDIQKYEIRFSEEFGEYRHSVKLEDVSFEWDDINGTECIEHCKLYQKSGDIIHLKLIAYHNFIDILREYLVGLTDLRVYDYLEGMIWNPLCNQLVKRLDCPICYTDCYSQEQLNTHIDSHTKKRKRK